MIIGPDATTLPALFAARVAATPDAPAYSGFEHGLWRRFTWAQAASEVNRMRASLARAGLNRGDRIGLCAYNSPQWVFADVAALSLGLIVVPLFFNDRPENTAYSIQDAGVRLLLVDRPPPPEVLTCDLKAILGLKDVPGVVPWDRGLAPDATAPFADESDQLATIVYTSGTTGRPKGVMLSHDNILADVAALLEAIPEVAAGTHRFLSFLPLSHMFERTVGQYVAMAMGAETVFSRGISELSEDLKKAKPTIIVSVPKIFERSYARIQETLKDAPLKARLVARAADLGYRRRHESVDWAERLEARITDLLVARPIRRRLGGRLQFVFIGGAPAAPSLLSFFTGMGLHFLPGYGLTEASPVITCHRLHDHDLRSVGRPLAGLEVRFVHDELWVRGPTVMQGYWGKPEATSEVLDSEGFLHTGDLGQLRDGLLYLTGRVKDIIVLSNGEKVAPADVEQAILQDTAFDQALIVGEGRGTLALLAHSTIGNEQVLRDRANAQLHAFPGYVRVQHVLPVPEPWTIENGFLTPTLKVRRKQVEQHYQAQIDALYQKSAARPVRS